MTPACRGDRLCSTLSRRSSFSKAARRPSPVSSRFASTKQPLAASGSRPVPAIGHRQLSGSSLWLFPCPKCRLRRVGCTDTNSHQVGAAAQANFDMQR
jgi:hypothetical protein